MIVVTVIVNSLMLAPKYLIVCMQKKTLKHAVRCGHYFYKMLLYHINDWIIYFFFFARLLIHLLLSIIFYSICYIYRREKEARYIIAGNVTNGDDNNDNTF